MHRLRPGPGRVAAAAAVVAVAGSLVLAPPARAVDGADCTGVDDVSTEKVPATDPSVPAATLQLEQAHDLVRSLSGREPGAGVTVAVVDAGVRVQPGLAVAEARRLTPYSRTAELGSYHGTAMAGLVAGAAVDGDLVGFAPAASLVDVRVYDSERADDDRLAPLTRRGLVAGLESVLPRVGPGTGQVDIVLVPVWTGPSARLEQVVDAITAAGGVVVAAAGDRGEEPAYEYGEDYARTFYPAGYGDDPLVVTVGSTLDTGTDPEAPDLRDDTSLVLSSAIDVAVPTYGAVSYAVNGVPCSLSQPATGVAAAEVAGVLALLMTAFPGDTPAQSVARLEMTATGASVTDPETPDKVLGRGVVQPVAALTRPLALDADGSPSSEALPAPAARRAALPRDEPDVLAGTRRHAVWWGLLGGGALVVALVLRPVLLRRRTGLTPSPVPESPLTCHDVGECGGP